MRKNAFTLIELIFVIVIVGIMSGVAMNRFSTTNELKLASEQLARHINYTKHLAMIDDKFKPVSSNSANNNDAQFWYRTFWQINLNNNGTYTIYSDTNQDGSPTSSSGEIAIDPHEREPLTKDLNSEYGVTISLSDNSCTHLYFDHLGRPYCSNNNFNMPTNNEHPYTYLLENNLTITISSSKGSKNITVIPTTGYISVN